MEALVSWIPLSFILLLPVIFGSFKKNRPKTWSIALRSIVVQCAMILLLLCGNQCYDITLLLFMGLIISAIIALIFLILDLLFEETGGDVFIVFASIGIVITTIVGIISIMHNLFNIGYLIPVYLFLIAVIKLGLMYKKKYVHLELKDGSKKNTCTIGSICKKFIAKYWVFDGFILYGVLYMHGFIISPLTEGRYHCFSFDYWAAINYCVAKNVYFPANLVSIAFLIWYLFRRYKNMSHKRLKFFLLCIPLIGIIFFILFVLGVIGEFLSM